MARKRDDLVLIGEAFGGLDGPVKTIRKASPQALHHFTLSDQVNQLAEAREAEPDLGFMARLMALCSLPRTNPGNRKEYVRRNGPYKLGMTAGLDNKLPYGNIPRLLLAWVCTEAVRMRKRELVLGRSLYEFMRKLGMEDRSGSTRGDRARLRNQMRRLFGSSITLIYEKPAGFARVSSFVADKHEFWWDPKQPNQSSLWESKIRLGEAFFQEIICRPRAAEHEHSEGAQALLVGPRSLPLADLPHLCTHSPAAPLLAAGVPPVRSGPGQGQRCEHRSNVPAQRAPRAKEDQARLAGAELRDGQGRASPLALEARDPFGRAAGVSELTSESPLTPQAAPLTALRRGRLPKGSAYAAEEWSWGVPRRFVWRIYPQIVAIREIFPR